MMQGHPKGIIIKKTQVEKVENSTKKPDSSGFLVLLPFSI
jgi:hypothetical protein